jgi:polyhydroxybutyrate depolymerase
MTETTLRGAILAALLLGACGGDGGPPGGVGDDDDDGDGAADAAPAADAEPGSPDAGGLVDERPYGLIVPDGYDPREPTPLVLLLHGYTASGLVQLAYFGLEQVAQERNILIAYPDGTIDPIGNRFWNATDACCDLSGSGVDDVAYLTAVLDDVASRYNVDPARVFAVGHSNGGFMSHRMACERADRIAAIVSLAGATWNDPARCEPSQPVSVLEVHGDLDETIRYAGGDIQGNAYPSAAVTVSSWAALNECGGQLGAGEEHLDLVSTLLGEETRVERFADCPAEGQVELWTLEGGTHVPAFVQPAWPEAIADFLLAHARP